MLQILFPVRLNLLNSKQINFHAHILNLYIRHVNSALVCFPFWIAYQNNTNHTEFPWFRFEFDDVWHIVCIALEWAASSRFFFISKTLIYFQSNEFVAKNRTNFFYSNFRKFECFMNFTFQYSSIYTTLKTSMKSTSTCSVIRCGMSPIFWCALSMDPSRAQWDYLWSP